MKVCDICRKFLRVRGRLPHVSAARPWQNRTGGSLHWWQPVNYFVCWWSWSWVVAQKDYWLRIQLKENRLGAENTEQIEMFNVIQILSSYCWVICMWGLWVFRKTCNSQLPMLKNQLKELSINHGTWVHRNTNVCMATFPFEGQNPIKPQKYKPSGKTRKSESLPKTLIIYTCTH